MTTTSKVIRLDDNIAIHDRYLKIFIFLKKFLFINN